MAVNMSTELAACICMMPHPLSLFAATAKAFVDCSLLLGMERLLCVFPLSFFVGEDLAIFSGTEQCTSRGSFAELHTV